MRIRGTLSTSTTCEITFLYTRRLQCLIGALCYHNFAQYYLKFVAKAVPVTGRGGPYVCEISRLPHLLQNRLIDGGEVLSLTRQPRVTTQENSWYFANMYFWVTIMASLGRFINVTTELPVQERSLIPKTEWRNDTYGRHAICGACWRLLRDTARTGSSPWAPLPNNLVVPTPCNISRIRWALWT
jgi:hypothetical protein